MKRIDVYSILIRNNFKTIDTDNDIFFRGYLYYFAKNVIEGEDKEKLLEGISAYNDEQFRKLQFRLKNNGHVN